MLDFSQITTQVQTYAGEHAREQPQRRAALEEASNRMRAAGSAWQDTSDKISESRTSWLLADWQEPPNQVFPAPERPLPHTLLAVDGSQIVADRHDIALCYVLNVGMITLRYGTGERAALVSRPLLAVPDDAMLDTGEGEQTAIMPRRLNMRRLLAEFAALAEMLPEGGGSASPALGMFDGSLILWQLETETEEFRAEVLQELETHLDKARMQGVPVAGYISRPQSRDVVNALRVSHCPYQQANCDRHCPNRARPKPHFVAPDCAGTERITDADLFAALLQPGERSALFGSRSKILHFYPPEHHVRFFYLHTGREVARIEIPAWVADDPQQLAHTHALSYDQARKGDGYPVALAEAHELAIVRMTERDAFFRLIERAFVTSHQPVASTQKALSKRARRV